MNILDPLGINAALKASRESVTAGTGTKSAVTARVSNEVLGQCPICGTPMSTALVGTVNTYVCLEHCVCLPMKD